MLGKGREEVDGEDLMGGGREEVEGEGERRRFEGERGAALLKRDGEKTEVGREGRERETGSAREVKVRYGGRRRQGRIARRSFSFTP
jgi:hypothetical protein